MSCIEIFNAACKAQGKLDAPVRIFPKCHPHAHCEVHADGRKRIIYLSCSKCDRPITRIKLKK